MAACEKLVASKYWRNLHGLLCLFKPSGLPIPKLAYSLKKTICSDLNKMKVRQPRKIVQYDATFEIPMETIETDYSDHPLIIGPRYELPDIRMYCPEYLGPHSSGVYVLGLNGGRKAAEDLEASKPLKVYHVTGELGIATEDGWKTGKKVQRATYSRVFRPHIDKTVAAIQASHQRQMYLNAGVHIQSQEAYDLAVKGLLRPDNEHFPIIYGIKCIDFSRPYFKIEVACSNEQEVYLLNLVHNIGMKLKSAAVCTGIKCIRYGPFTLDHSLLQHSWHAEKLVSNIEQCNSIYEEDLKSGRRDKLILSPLNPMSDEIDTSSSNNKETHRERRIRLRSTVEKSDT